MTNNSRKSLAEQEGFTWTCCDHVRPTVGDELDRANFIFTDKSQYTAGLPARVYEPFVQIGEWKMLVLCMNCGSRFENNVLVALMRSAIKEFMNELLPGLGVRINVENPPGS